MLTHPRSWLAALLALFLASLAFAQEEIKWSRWRPLDETMPGVKIRTGRDDNEGRGWNDGTFHWRYELKNTFKNRTIQVSLSFAQFNRRTKEWEAPADKLPPPQTLEPGDVHEGWVATERKDNFDYKYAIRILQEGASPDSGKMVSGVGSARPPKAASALVDMGKGTSSPLAEEMKVSAPGQAVVTEPAPPTPSPVKAAKVRAQPAPSPTPPSPAIPASLPTSTVELPPAVLDGLDAKGKFALWQQRAAQGEAASMFELGRACRYGQGTAQDNVAATEWYRQAALRGHAEAMTKLGFAYDSGLGVERSESSAIEWWQKAAALGEPDALKRLTKLGLAPAKP